VYLSHALTNEFSGPMSLQPTTTPFRLHAGLMAAVVALLLSACATPPEDPVELAAFKEANDPFEPANRFIFAVNVASDELVLRPIVTMYDEGIPDPYRAGVRNFLDNIAMPVTILNSALQADWENTIDASVSFFINTTAGLGGIFDIPGNFDEEPRKEDFGQTLAVWGIGEGPFITLPFVGPSNVRDTVGLGVDIATDPLTYLLSPGWTYARTALQAVRARSDIGEHYDNLQRTSIDFYAALRSLYRQNRNYAIANGLSDEPDLDAFDDTGSTTFQAAE